METNKNETNKKGEDSFMKRYANYIILSSVVFVLLFAILILSVAGNANKSTTPVNSPEVIAFQSPVMNGEVAMGFSDSELQYNKTLNVWKVHKGVDFVAEIGTEVLCAYDGRVTNITSDILHGTVVEVDHGNGLKTTYGSLDSKTMVKVGDEVLKGDVLGKASNTATEETSDAGEVHFEVWKDGNLVDPANYLDISNGK